MELKDLVAIAGQSGLHKVIGRSKSGLIVETLGTGRRFSTSFQDKVSVLDDISVYTQEEDLRLGKVFLKMKESGEAPEAKTDLKLVREYLVKTIQLDSERVYDNDIKKLINWYHQLKDVLDFTKLDQEETSEENAEGGNKETHEHAEEKIAKVAAPKTTKPKNTAPKNAPKANTKAASGNTTYRPKAV